MELDNRYIIGSKSKECFWSDWHGGNWQMLSCSTAQEFFTEKSAQDFISILQEKGYLSNQDDVKIYTIKRMLLD